MSNKVRPCTLLDDEFFTKTRFPIAYYDTDIAVQREEERETAFAEGEEKGAHRKALETAKAMKVEGFASGLIAKITGLDEEAINRV